MTHPARRTLLPLLLATALAPAPAAAAEPGLTPDASRLERFRATGALLDEQRNEEAAATLAALAAENPFDGRLEFRLGRALRAAGDHDGAAAAWERAISLGFAPADAAYNIACSRALQRRADDAFLWLARSYELGFLGDETAESDPDFESLRADPRFRSITGFPAPTGLSRADQWRSDLDHLLRRMEQVHFDLYAKVSREDLSAAFGAIKSRADDLSDADMIAHLRRALALVGDGHTLVAGLGTVAQPPRIPLEMEVFTDGLFITGAPPDRADLLGARVLRVWGVPAQAALDAVKPFRSVDNPMGHLDQGPGLLIRPEVLRAAGVARAVDRIELTVQPRAGAAAIDVRLDARPFDPQSPPAPTRWKEDWPPLPLRRAAAAKPYELIDLPSDGVTYVRWREVASAADEPFDRFCARLFAHLDANPGRALVLDLRDNGGGDTGLIVPMIAGVASRRALGDLDALYVIIGRGTFSAAQNTVGQLEKYCDPIFVGEPTGSSPNFTGESTPIVLPCTRVVVWCSNRRWYTHHSEDPRIWIAPHVAAQESSDDYFAGRDPALQAVLREERARRAAAP